VKIKRPPTAGQGSAFIFDLPINEVLRRGEAGREWPCRSYPAMQTSYLSNAADIR
jgi:hypothetical protein